MPVVVGLVGFAHTGKDTVADMLGCGWNRTAFADPLKDAFAEYHGIPRCWCDGVDEYGTPINRETKMAFFNLLHHVHDEHTGNPVSIREGLQRFGMAMRDTFGKDFWVHRAIESIFWAGPQDQVVFTDVRFDNELEAIRDMGGKVVLISRPGVERVNDHSSENLAEEFMKGELEPDFHIENDGTLEDLAASVERLKEML